MEPLLLDNGKKVIFWHYTGIVIASEKHHQTHIQSSGGGGYINLKDGYGHGRINDIRVTNTITTDQEFWLQLPDGYQMSIYLEKCMVPLREGHTVTLICAGLEGTQKGKNAVIVNHSTKQFRYACNGIILVYTSSRGIGAYKLTLLNIILMVPIFAILCFLALSLLFSILTVSITTGFAYGLMISSVIGLPLGIILSIISYNSKGKKIGIKVEQHLDKLAQRWLKLSV